MIIDKFNMKKALLLLGILFTGLHAVAQWQGTNPVYFNAGFVGIGTSNPEGYLHVNPVRPVIIKNNGGNGVYGSEIGFNAVLNTSVVPNTFRKLGNTSQRGGAVIAVDYTGNMLFQMYGAGTENESVTSFNPQVSFLNNGRVGIATVNPQTQLNILQGAGDAIVGTPTLRIGGTDNYPSLELGIKGAYDGMISTYGNDLHLYAGNWRVANAVATENHNISFYTSQAGTTNWNTPKMYLRYDGNFGIGTTSPKGTLQVNSIRPVIIKNNGGNGVYGSEIGFNAVLDTSTPANKFIKLGGTAQRGGAAIVVDNEGSMYFQMHYGGTEAETIVDYNPQISFLHNGYVGIGTSSPDARLAVKGNIHTQEVLVDLSGAVTPDYVFEKEYDLLPLSELESYINENKHLPEVPSAKEMEENGLNLKEMNLLLLKKVEELTLHLIEQNKKIENQQIEIEKIKNNK
jgi:hypothetical protein